MTFGREMSVVAHLAFVCPARAGWSRPDAGLFARGLDAGVISKYRLGPCGGTLCGRRLWGGWLLGLTDWF